MKFSELNEQLIKKGYSLKEYRRIVEKVYTLKKGRKEMAFFEFEIECLPFCCGAMVLGDMRFECSPTLPEEDKILLFRAMLTKECENLKLEEWAGSMPLIFTTNGKDFYEIIEKAMLHFSSNFKLVSTTKNPYTANTVKVYISSK